LFGWFVGQVGVAMQFQLPPPPHVHTPPEYWQVVPLGTLEQLVPSVGALVGQSGSGAWQFHVPPKQVQFMPA
jgi:hypothetical protein